jgi:type II secretory pathway pseudopilin PulG/uncharacterized protein (DUF2141 family)
MNTIKHVKATTGFTLVEMVLTILALGFVLIAVSGIFVLFQKSSAQTKDFAEVQQNARIALDYMANHLRQAGSQTDYFRGQAPIVHAGPYQIAVNADIDNGQTIDGLAPLSAINRAYSPNTVPTSGTTIYTPAADYQSDAETVVFTLDSNSDGVVSSNDRGDDPEEDSANTNLFILKKVIYGFNGSTANEVRESDVALVRGPNLAPTWTIPEPLFQYYYDHDEDIATDDRLWGDTDNSGALDTGEILAVTPMPQNLLGRIRKVKINAISESHRYDKKFETNGGFLNVTMTSEVYVRNISRSSSMVQGRVFHDADGDGVMDAGETGLPGVEIRLAGQNRTAVTDNFGLYYFALPAGDYSIQEVDPLGYTSTTPNLVSVTLVSGQMEVVNFGDLSSSPIGVIRGTVYEDQDQDGLKGVGEPGITGVLISLDNGAQTFTDDTGYYSFIAEEGNYTVVETDPVGYSSTTPNSIEAIISAAGDTVTANFGDYAGPVSGSLEGYVFLDENEDGIRNNREEGIPNVSIKVSNGDSTLTNANGYYRFSLAPDTYFITETDPDGYTSTTVNTYIDIPIVVDTTVVRDFGDVLEERQDFLEINISNTDRALSVCTADLDEDEKNDMDIVLGTALAAGFGNMLVFHNNWETSATPISELFDSDPIYRREAGENINTLSRFDFSEDGTPDILSGLNISTERNVQIWFTGAGGVLSVTPDVAYYSSGLNVVMDGKLADLDLDGVTDLVVGLRSPVGTAGGFETFLGSGSGVFTSREYITTAGSLGDINLGQIWAVETGDVDRDGDQDIIVGSHITDYSGYIDIYLNTGYASATFAWYARYRSWGAVNDLVVLDIDEDDGQDPDILTATSTGDNVGLIMLWLNASGVFGLPDTTAMIAYGPDEMQRLPDDYVNAGGEALSLGIIYLNNDVFPDVAYGTRSSSLFTGDIYTLATYGTLPTHGDKINVTQLGEIVTLDIADFNKDGKPDIVVGTRSSATQGRLVAYFGK